MTVHVTLKNLLSVIIGVCVLGLAVIPLAVPVDHLAWIRWQAAIIVLAVAAVIALFWQAAIQSREDHERDTREGARDKRQDETNQKMTEVLQLLKHPPSSPDRLVHPTTASGPSPESPAPPDVGAEFDSEIYRVVIAGKGMGAELTRDLFRVSGRLEEFAIDADILVEMYIVNASTEKRYIRDFSGTVEVDGKVLPLLRQSDFYAFDFSDHEYEYCLNPNEESHLDRSNLEALPPIFPTLPLELEARKPTEGWIHFIVKDVDPQKLNGNRSYKFTITDSLGKEHPVLKVSTVKRRGEVTVRQMRR